MSTNHGLPNAKAALAFSSETSIVIIFALGARVGRDVITVWICVCAVSKNLSERCAAKGFVRMSVEKATVA
jgi:hypothetical protein